jgi:hypothetical protein
MAAGAAAGGCVSAGGGDAGAGVSLAGGVTAAVVGDGAAGADVEAAAASFAASEAGIAPVVVGAGVAAPDGGKYIVVPPDELWDADSSAMAAGTTPAQQTPNKLTPRRRRAKSLIIPRLAPIGEGRDNVSVADTT